jgi:hypothetical protein
MKILYVFLILIFSQVGFSREIVKKTNTHFQKKLRQNEFICKQKNIPLSAVGEYSQNLLKIYLSPDVEIKNFSILNVRGIDNVKIGKYQEIKNVDLNLNEEIETQVEITDLQGLAYVVLDIGYEVDGKYTNKSLPVPLGILSGEQIKRRKGSIKAIKTNNAKPTSNGLSSPTESVHYMKLGE